MSRNVITVADDSDSDSLPDLSDIIDVPPSSISKGNIVWAKYKHLYWPALVRSVHTKEKKISVWYTDEPGKTFKLPLKKVCSFNDAEMRSKIVKDVREAGCMQEHEGLTSHALRYVKRKAEGYVDDPMKFFDQTYPFYLMEDLLRKNPDANVSSIKIPPLYISRENKNINKRISAPKVKSTNVESKNKSSSNDSESDAESTTKDYISKVKQEYSSITRKDENINKIVEFIKSGKADGYLKKILSKRISSKHRDEYENAVKCCTKMTNLTYTGPIESDEKLRELIFYLLPLYSNMTSAQKSKRYSTRQCKTKFLEYPSFDKSDSAQYVASVWLPEAIIYAMSEIYNISLSDAKRLFREETESVTEVEKIIASLGSADKSCNSEINEKFLEENTQPEQHSSNIEIHSPLKKVRVVHKKKKNY